LAERIFERFEHSRFHIEVPRSLRNKKINFSQVFAGQAVVIKEMHDDIWLVSFLDSSLALRPTG
jgi:hypothetical protein